MKSFMIMIPFIGVFLFAGFQWQFYNDQFGMVDNYIENGIYSAINIDKLRGYEETVINEDLGLQLLKYFSLESNKKTNGEIEVQEQGNIVKVKTGNEIFGKKVGIIKNYILDSSA